MRISGFSKEAWDHIETLLFEELDLTGKCDQKQIRKSKRKPRTPAQQQADKQRSQEMRGEPQPRDRSVSARKAAQTRKKCG